MARELHLTRTFERLFERLPREIQDQAYEKLALFLEDPSRPDCWYSSIGTIEGISISCPPLRVHLLPDNPLDPLQHRIPSGR